MAKIVIQIYEIQEPGEAELMVETGVDRIGSVIMSESEWKVPLVREAVRLVNTSDSESSLIPLFSQPDFVFRVIDYYEPDTIHFCETIVMPDGTPNGCGQLVELQKGVKARFPEVKIMRSIPIPATGTKNDFSFDRVKEIFEPFSDCFLTDTMMTGDTDHEVKQPVQGFIGITGKTCDWETAARLVKASSMPVILAGGISPDNVYDCIAQTKPFGVDSCTLTNAVDSRGEPIRFKKDPEKTARFVSEARRAENDFYGG
ncbi:MAG: hypothetical protein JRF40_09595 [Deltaproteobacteria bacterium]|nr:hypothetical protein [Deltaproteobacteria bacterium]